MVVSVWRWFWSFALLIPKEPTSGRANAKRAARRGAPGADPQGTNERADQHQARTNIMAKRNRRDTGQQLENFRCKLVVFKYRPEYTSRGKRPAGRFGRVRIEPPPFSHSGPPKGGPHYLACALASYALFSGSRSVLVLGAPRGGGFVCT